MEAATNASNAPTFDHSRAKRQFLTILPETAQGLTACKGSGGCHLAWGMWFEPDKKYRVSYDGRLLEPAVDKLIPPGIVISPDGLRVAYAVSMGTFNRLFDRDGKTLGEIAPLGARTFVVVDEKAGPEVSALGEKLVFSPDSKHLAYRALVNDGEAMIIDGHVERAFDQVGDTPVFSADGKHCAYAARDGQDWYMVLDGQIQQPSFDLVSAPVFSPDGERIAFAAQKGAKWLVITDGKPSPKLFDGIGQMYFSPDSRHLAYGAMKDGKCFIVIDEVEGPAFDSVGPVVFSPKGEGLVYSAFENGKAATVGLDGRPGPWYDGRVGSQTFSSDGSHLAYIVIDHDEMMIVLDGKEGPWFGGVSPVLFAGEGDATAYAYACCPKGLEEYTSMVVNGTVGRDYDGILFPEFSHDGRTLAYVAKQDEQCCVVIGTTEGPRFAGIMVGPEAMADGTWEYLAVEPDAQKPDRLRLIRVTVPQREQGEVGTVPHQPAREPTVSGPIEPSERVSTVGGAKKPGELAVQREGGPVAGQKWTVPDLAMEMVYVEPGSFEMGSNSGDSDEKPVHAVRISRPFWMGKCEVTQTQYQAIVGTNSCYFKGGDLPVESVSWNDALEFCRRLTDRERRAGRLPSGYVYRLPTEAEWEYAARGGAKGARFEYAGSSDLDEVAWNSSDSAGKTHPVGQKKPNELGLHDMSGNVWEWCHDVYDTSYYANSVSSDPTGAASGLARVLRGGSWHNDPGRCRASSRFRGSPGGRGSGNGFRVVASWPLD